MSFEMNDRVVYPAFGVGRIVGLTAKTVGTAASQMYYEVSGDRTTAWVQVDEGEAGGLRALTRKDELGHFRAVLRGQPEAMNADFRQRQLAVRDQLKAGTLQSVCEVVRDLNGRSWVKTLNDSDLHTLRRSSNALEMRARLHVTRDGKDLGVLSAGKNRYFAEQQTSNEVAIRSDWLRAEDLFVIVGKFNNDGSVFLKVLINPLVNLIWLAGLVFVGGSLITMWPDAREQRRLARRFAYAPA